MKKLIRIMAAFLAVFMLATVVPWQETAYAAVRENGTIPIADVHGRGIGEEVTVEGYVTGVFKSGSATAESHFYFIQDDSGRGIEVRAQIPEGKKVGDYLKLSATTQAVPQQSSGSRQLVNPVILGDSGATINPPEPVDITNTEWITRFTHGTLVTARRMAVNAINQGSPPNVNPYINVSEIPRPGTRSIRIENSNVPGEDGYVPAYNVEGILDPAAVDAVYGVGFYDITGIAYYPAGTRLRVRSQEDIRISEFEDDDAPVIAPVTVDGRPLLGESQKLSTTIGEGGFLESVRLYLKLPGGADYTKIDETDGVRVNPDRSWSYTITGDRLAIAGDISYYLEAEDKNGNIGRLPESGAATIEIIDDVTGPEATDLRPLRDSQIRSVKPEISAQYRDISDIDIEGINLKIDGADVTAQAEVIESGIRYIPAEGLSLGLHTVLLTMRDKDGNVSTEEWSFTVVQGDGEGFHPYVGSMQNHTELSSDAVGSPENAIAAAKANGYDFFVLSDYSHDLTGSRWQDVRDLAERSSDSGFTVIPGFNLASTQWGQVNLFGSEEFIDRRQDEGRYNQDIEEVYAWVGNQPGTIGQFNAPADGTFGDFLPYDREASGAFSLLEVGEGSGRYGYTNYEKRYYEALDKGWHVAPTYGENNHDGVFGQTRPRTVILAGELNREALLEAIHANRVYMTEDTDFRLNMLANGEAMGSRLADSDYIEFALSGTDTVQESYSGYTGSDEIARVEIIGNTGRVVAFVNPEGTSFSWGPVVQGGGSSWYVVKITQEDGDRIYSAPVWTPQADTSVRPSGITAKSVASDKTQAKEVEITAHVTNAGSAPLHGITVDFYHTEVLPENKIGSATIDGLEAGETAAAFFNWTSPSKKTYEIIAQVVPMAGDDPADNRIAATVYTGDPTEFPHNVILTLSGDPKTTQSFSWESAFLSAGQTRPSVLEIIPTEEYTRFPQRGAQKVTGSSHNFRTNRCFHEVTATGLAPGTSYTYRVGDGEGHWSEAAAFRTEGEEDSFHIAWVTDTQQTSYNGWAKPGYRWSTLLDRALEKVEDIDMILHTGDIAQTLGSIENYDDVFGVAADYLRSIPFVPVVGNHDIPGFNQFYTPTYSDYVTERFALPQNWADRTTGGEIEVINRLGYDPLTETCFSFDYGNAHIAVLNTVTYTGENSTVAIDGVPYRTDDDVLAQAEWLKNDMQASDKTWKIVALHRSPYGSVYQPTSGDLREKLVPAIDEAGVDLVLAGHDHVYARSYPMRGGVPVEPGEGTIYILGGSSGPKFYDLQPYDWQDVTYDDDIPVFSTITATEDSLDLNAYNVLGESVDRLTLSAGVPSDTTVDIMAIFGVTPPATGETPVTTITETEQYTGTVAWNPAHNPFEANIVYTATINLTPKAGYTLTGVAENAFTVEGTASVNNAADSGVITAVFPATATDPTGANRAGITVEPITILGKDRTITFRISAENLRDVWTMEGTMKIEDTEHFEIASVRSSYEEDKTVFQSNIGRYGEGTAYFILARIGGLENAEKTDIAEVRIRLKEGASASSLEAFLNSIHMYRGNPDDHTAVETDSEIAKGSAVTQIHEGGIPGDLNGDGNVTALDLAISLTCFGLTSDDAKWYTSGAWKADFDGNGVIDITDISTLAWRVVHGLR